VSHLITYKNSKGFPSANEGGLRNENHCKNKRPGGLWTHTFTSEMDLFCGINLLQFYLNRQLLYHPHTMREGMNDWCCKNTPPFAFVACTGATLPFSLMKTAHRKSKKTR
jgi:hypothetical protein